MNRELEEKVTAIAQYDDRFAVEAYDFIGRAVEFAVQRRFKEQNESRHVTAAELLEEMVIFAGQEFGPFTEKVLRGWGINTAADIGDIVYNMIKVKALSADDRDKPEDFRIDFDLFADSRHAAELIEPKVEVPLID